MSSGVGGSVLIVPVAGAVIGAAAVVGVGVGICYVAGRGLIAGAQAINDRIDTHAAQRRASHSARVALYRRSREAAAEQQQQLPQRQQISEAARREVQQQIDQLASIRARLSAPLEQPQPFDLPPLEASMTTIPWPPPGEKHLVSALDLEKSLDRLHARHRAARKALRIYEESGAWGGLFRVQPVFDALREADEAMKIGGLTAANQHLGRAERLLNQMESRAVARWKERADALNVLLKASGLLDQVAPLTTEYPEIQTQLEGLIELLNEAQAHLDGGDFVHAAALAKPIVRHAETLVATPELWQRRLLLAEIDELRAEITGHGEFDQAADWLKRLDEAQTLLMAQTPTAETLAQMVEVVEQVGHWADSILHTIKDKVAGTLARQKLAELAAQELERMGYQVEWTPARNMPPSPAEEWRLTGRRPAPRDPERIQTFIIDLRADGYVWFDATQGYKGKECDDMITLINALQSRGVEAYWRPFYNAEQAAGPLREMLLADGYSFDEENSDEGLVYTIYKDGPTGLTAKIGWDGSKKEESEQLDRIAERYASQYGYGGRINAEREEIELERWIQSTRLRR